MRQLTKIAILLYLTYILFQAWCLPILGGDSTSVLFTAPSWYVKFGIGGNYPWFYPLQVYGMLIQVQMLVFDNASPIISAGFMVMSALLVWHIGNKHFKPGTGELATLLLLSIHVTRIIEYYGLNESLMTFFLLLAVDSILEKRWWYAGIFIGISLGIDYTSMIYCGVFMLWAGKNWWKILIPAFLLALPWYLPNIILHGNPIYPFLSTVSDSDLSSATRIAPHNYEFGIPFMLSMAFVFLSGRKGLIISTAIAICVLLLCTASGYIHARFLFPSMAILAIPAAAGIKSVVKKEDVRIIVVSFIIAYIVFISTPGVPIGVPASGHEQAITMLRLYPCFGNTMQATEQYPYATIYYPREMNGYRFYTYNRISPDVMGADLAVTPYGVYPFWIPESRNAFIDEAQSGKITLDTQREIDFLKTWRFVTPHEDVRYFILRQIRSNQCQPFGYPG